MGIAITRTVTCDCCGYVVPAGEAYQAADWLGKVYCTKHLCDTGVKADLATKSYTAASAAHVALIIAGIIPNHP